MIPATPSWSSAVAQNGAMAGTLALMLEIDQYAKVFTSWDSKTAGQYPWIRLDGTESLSQSSNDLSGGANLSNLSIEVLDYQNQITADLAIFSFQGKKVTIKIGLTSMPQSDFITLATMLVNKVDSSSNNTAYTFDLRDNSLLLQNKVFLIGDNGYSTSSNSPVTLEGAPLTLAQNALSQAGLPAGSINTAAINTLVANVLYGLNFRFQVTYPAQAKSWIEQEVMTPLACWWFWNYLGQFTPVTMIPYAAPAPVMTLDQTLISVKTLPVAKQSDSYISDFAYFMDLDSNGQNAGNIFESVYAPAFNIYGLSQSHQIRSRGVRSALGGYRIAQLVMYAICQRYGFKPLTCSVDCSLPAALIEIGDKVTLNHPNMPDRKGGVMGTAGSLWEVTGKRFNFASGITSLSLLNVSWQLNAAYQIAPSGIPNYPAASQAQRNQYMFVAGAGNTYSTGAAGNKVY